GSAGVFSIVFKPEATKAQVQRFVDGLELFEIGYSWGGVTSLAVAYDFQRAKGRPDYGYRIVRLNVGLEDTEDLIEDLERTMGRVWGN
ncbi:MAG: PLP-dependent transferase, partial [Candidatus Sulfotelmatobacter sp.]